MIKDLFFKITGGRPMIDKGPAFKGMISRDYFHYFVDRLGRHWITCNGPWSLFRAKTDVGKCRFCSNIKDEPCEYCDPKKYK